MRNNDFQNEALEKLALVDKYNSWIVSKFKKHLKGDILELGSGLGNITNRLLKNGHNITSTDIDRKYLSTLKKINRNTKFLDIENLGNKKVYKYDTIIAINVIEHIKDDEKVFRNSYKLLNSKGIFIVLVPAHKFLFGSYDVLADHKRRYSISEMEKKLKKAGFKIREIGYYNKISAIAWFLNARVLKSKSFSKSQLSLVNLLVPLIDALDSVIPFNFGMSLICIAEKKAKDGI